MSPIVVSFNYFLCIKRLHYGKSPCLWLESLVFNSSAHHIMYIWVMAPVMSEHMGPTLLCFLIWFPNVYVWFFMMNLMLYGGL